MRDASRRLVVWMHSERYPTWSIPDAAVQALERCLGPAWEVECVRVPTVASGDGTRTVPPEVLRAVRDAEIYFGFGIARETFLAAPRLRWVHSGAAGVGASLFPEMVRSDVLFTNSAGVYAEPLAEWALGAMLHFSRGLDIATAARTRKEWPYDRLAGVGTPLFELAGAVVAIVGYGGIGRAIGRRCAALGMRVVAVGRGDRLTADLPPGGCAASIAELHRVLPECSVLVLSVPETPATKGVVGARELSLLAPGAILINLSRGGIVDEDALIEVLRRGEIRGAALDVFREEPLPARSPLWELENVLITPHSGSISPRFWERQTALMMRNIGHYLAGSELENLVQKERGY